MTNNSFISSLFNGEGNIRAKSRYIVINGMGSFCTTEIVHVIKVGISPLPLIVVGEMSTVLSRKLNREERGAESGSGVSCNTFFLFQQTAMLMASVHDQKQCDPNDCFG